MKRLSVCVVAVLLVLAGGHATAQTFDESVPGKADLQRFVAEHLKHAAAVEWEARTDGPTITLTFTCKDAAIRRSFDERRYPVWFFLTGARERPVHYSDVGDRADLDCFTIGQPSAERAIEAARVACYSKGAK